MRGPHVAQDERRSQVTKRSSATVDGEAGMFKLVSSLAPRGRQGGGNSVC